MNSTKILELETLKEDIIKSCSTCQNGSCRVGNSEKIGLDEDGKPMGYNCVGYINHDLESEKVIVKKL